jgi:prepilin-type N-terminal cleavage/methylation domain-containing protein
MRRFTRKAEGYTLVELLIVLAIVGMVAGGIVGVYQVSQGIYTRATALEEAQLGARAGLDRMASELRLIGSYWVGANCVGIANCNAITAASSNSITFRANVDDSSVIGGAGGNEATTSAAANGNSVLLTAAAIATGAFRCYTNPALNDYIYIANGGSRDVKQIASINGNATCNNTNNNTIGLASALSSTYPLGSIVRDVKTITYARNAATNILTRSQGGSGADPVVDNVSVLTFTYFRSDGVTPTTDPALIREIQIDLTACVKRTIASSCQDPDSSSRQMTTRVKPRSLP